MNALRISGYVDKDGLNVGIDKLKIFKNKNVEIIILPKDESGKFKTKTGFYKAIGKIDIDQNEIQSLRELSKI